MPEDAIEISDELYSELMFGQSLGKKITVKNGFFSLDDVTLSSEEAMALIRKKRNELLSNSDWTQVLDAPVNKFEWAEYRQALRDLPQNTTDPFNPVWPAKPE